MSALQQNRNAIFFRQRFARLAHACQIAQSVRRTSAAASSRFGVSERGERKQIALVSVHGIVAAEADRRSSRP